MADAKLIAFTTDRLQNISAAVKDRDTYRDERQPGLIIRVNTSGSKTFYFYRKIRGRPVRLKLGSFPDMTIDQARKECREMNVEIDRGNDPAQNRRQVRAEPTLQVLYDHWMTTHAQPKKKTWREDERQYKKYLHHWGNRKLSAIQRADIQRMHSEVGQKHGHYAANRVLALLRAMYNLAIEIGYEGGNPTVQIKKFSEEKRDRFLHEDEVKLFFQALSQESNPIFIDFFWLCLLTGARKENVLSMRWADISMESQTWRIPKTKGGTPVVVPLVEPAIEILRNRQKETEKQEWVFPSYGKTGHLAEPKTAWKRVLVRAGLNNLRIHDLRRSLASWMAMNDTGLPVIGKMLGQTQASTTQIYARLQVKPVKEAAEKAVKKILSIVGESDNRAKVVDDVNR